MSDVSIASRQPDLTISIVSHGHGVHVGALLSDFVRLLDDNARRQCEFLLTLNIPEDEAFVAQGSGLALHVHRNPVRLGFGANHNAAFARAAGRHFVVLNPDIRLHSWDVAVLTEAFCDPSIGVIAPKVVDSAGVLQDNVRRFPTLRRLAWRFVTRDWRSEYPPTPIAQRVDWAAGMCLVVRRDAWASVGGFDERYHMYFEDVDLCRRLGRRGWGVLYMPAFEMVHDARRATHRNTTHLRWHMRSAIRYYTGV